MDLYYPMCFYFKKAIFSEGVIGEGIMLIEGQGKLLLECCENWWVLRGVQPEEIDVRAETLEEVFHNYERDFDRTLLRVGEPTEASPEELEKSRTIFDVSKILTYKFMTEIDTDLKEIWDTEENLLDLEKIPSQFKSNELNAIRFVAPNSSKKVRGMLFKPIIGNNKKIFETNLDIVTLRDSDLENLDLVKRA